MLITKRSQLTDKWHTLDINVKQDQIDDWKNGMLIQYAMPNVNEDDREFIMTGITKKEWDTLMKQNEEDCFDWWYSNNS